MVEAKTDNLSASLEDYLEAIFNLAGESNFARSRDIAKLLGVSRASVTGALRTLKKRGLANYKPYDYVTLTEAGQAAAAEVARKHDILKSFFVSVLGINPNIAQKAACKAEHALGPVVITRLLWFIDFVAQGTENGHDLVDQFKQFCRKNLPRTRNKKADKRRQNRWSRRDQDRCR
jgi:DtxR family Mn-dependent transcriptional regulator